ncbi:MAG: bifunctional phosphopantothenoylcysteine decarboxylase/phosphopantothenate--cysteine ligase CoaBC [Saprospirales bacterium]|nr:bifunctional phosphopantothenoylcysteine decarboxylase/phosphopantothenate--cysteine ligase CoaBC [Saprospirales bacterium]MBK8491490.1 bifunctional phosphopantothenoylcysteine decarboxylase/phosphopantothenate--cysteine ligase CoaBC [Saprospirales bacterium]
MVKGKKIILGISGSIAAYKAAHLTRLLVKAGAEVQVLMTRAATDFITPLTLSTLSKRPVLSDFHAEESWNNHVELGLWADVLVLAPLTATTLAKLASGLADNVLVATYLSARCPVFFAPAMDVDMWKHPSTQRNVQLLESYGNRLIPVGFGELASGLTGEGRMAEPEEIVALLNDFFSEGQPLAGKRALVTAGPTYEAIDPVRFIGNYSSGKMGVAIAERLAALGAQVDLILGPSSLNPVHPHIRLHRVRSAQEMYEASLAVFDQTDMAVLSAAVADYRPANPASEKIKKDKADMRIDLESTPDIAAALGARKKAGQVLVGFALETENELENARAKRQKKNLDFIVLNSLRDAGAGFHHDTNKITLVFEGNKTEEFQLKSKREVADDIVAALIRFV